MTVATAKYGFGDKWKDIWIDNYEGFYPNMSDYHMHEYFEISFIVSGNVNILLTDSMESSTGSKIVLLRPNTPHYIYCEPDILYSRTNLCFSKNFTEDFLPELHRILNIFGENGTVIAVDTEKIKDYVRIVNKIKDEENPLRQKLLIMYVLSLVSDNMNENEEITRLPRYVTDALSYIGTHYTQKIVASELAEKLGIGRTTLMQGFKKYTGTTFNEYLLGCRLKRAVIMLEEGKKLWEIADTCGFTDAPNFIRSFKRHFGTTPNMWRRNSN